jgi:hypothetical protein
MDISLSSVLLLPRDRIAAMTRDRVFLLKTSAISRLQQILFHSVERLLGVHGGTVIRSRLSVNGPRNSTSFHSVKGNSLDTRKFSITLT